jgi:hypothetical protein
VAVKRRRGNPAGAGLGANGKVDKKASNFVSRTRPKRKKKRKKKLGKLCV